jgi:hypothetical protein
MHGAPDSAAGLPNNQKSDARMAGATHSRMCAVGRVYAQAKCVTDMRRGVKSRVPRAPATKKVRIVSLWRPVCPSFMPPNLARRYPINSGGPGSLNG